MSFRFTPEDFHYLCTSDRIRAAKDANALLEAEKKKCVRIYGQKAETIVTGWSFGTSLGDFDTHTALLWDLKPIEKEKVCEHLLDASWMDNGGTAKCLNCDRKLKVTLEVCE